MLKAPRPAASKATVTDDHDRLLELHGDLRVLDTNLAALTESIDVRLDARDRALMLQAAEIARRLDNLNHEHERLAADRVAFASNERLDGTIRELIGRFEPQVKQNSEHIASLELGVLKTSTYEERHTSLVDRVSVLETFRARAMGFGALLALLSGVIGAAIGRAVG